MAKPEVLDYAKELFLTPHQDDPGKRQYSYQQIADKITQDLNENYTREAVVKWADKPDGNGMTWKMLWAKGQHVGTDKIAADKKARQAKDEAYINTVSDDKSARQQTVEKHFKSTAEFVSMIIKQELETIRDCLDKKIRYEPSDSILRFMQTNYLRLNESIAHTEKDEAERRNMLVDLFNEVLANPVILQDKEIIDVLIDNAKKLEKVKESD